MQGVCVFVCVCSSTQNDLYQTIKTQFCLFVTFGPLLYLIPRLCLSVFLSCFTSRPLIKLSITWRKNGMLLNRGLRDFGRRLTISGPLVSDSGYYECEASLRSSSAPSVSAGAYLHVMGNSSFLSNVTSELCLKCALYRKYSSPLHNFFLFNLQKCQHRNMQNQSFISPR